MLIDRKTAKLAGLSKYFTGQPCVNGHVAERYTLSGTCQECIAASTAAAREQYKTIMVDPSKDARRAFAQAAVSHKVRVHLPALPGIVAMVAAITLGRFPGLAGAEFLEAEPKLTDRQGPTAMARFTVHPDDVPAVVALCRHSLDVLGSQPVAPPITPPKFLATNAQTPTGEFLP